MFYLVCYTTAILAILIIFQSLLQEMSLYSFKTPAEEGLAPCLCYSICHAYLICSESYWYNRPHPESHLVVTSPEVLHGHLHCVSILYTGCHKLYFNLYFLHYIRKHLSMADQKDPRRGSPLQGRRSHDAMGFRHLQLVWHLVPSRDQERRYRQAWIKHTLLFVKRHITHGASRLILLWSEGFKATSDHRFFISHHLLWLSLPSEIEPRTRSTCYPPLRTVCPGPNDVS